MEYIDEKIVQLIKKADAAQRAGDYEAMRKYDQAIEELREKKMLLLKAIYDSGTKKRK